MSDLTRRVLEAQKRRKSILNTPDSLYEDGMLREYHQAGDAIMKTAPTLARQVEAVEALADRLDAEAERVGPRGGGFTALMFAAKIRDALTEAEKGNTP